MKRGAFGGLTHAIRACGRAAEWSGTARAMRLGAVGRGAFIGLGQRLRRRGGCPRASRPGQAGVLRGEVEQRAKPGGFPGGLAARCRGGGFAAAGQRTDGGRRGKGAVAPLLHEVVEAREQLGQLGVECCKQRREQDGEQRTRGRGRCGGNAGDGRSCREGGLMPHL